jgi:hypothetical protein
VRIPILRIISIQVLSIGFAVHAGVLDEPAVCRMFNDIIGRFSSQRYLSSDNDPLFLFRQWNANQRILEVMEVKTVSYAHLSHPFVESLIGTLRREYLVRVPFWGALDPDRLCFCLKIIATMNVLIVDSTACLRTTKAVSRTGR